MLRTVHISTDQWDLVLLIVIPWLQETSAFLRRPDKGTRLLILYWIILTPLCYCLFFPTIFALFSPDLSGEFYGGVLIKIFIDISSVLTRDNCRVDINLHVSHWVWGRFHSEYFDLFCQYHSTTLYTRLTVTLFLSQGQVGKI